MNGDHEYVYAHTTASVAAGTSAESVTFTNTHTAEPVTLHVAMGQNGVLSNRDDQRTGNADIYTLTVTNGAGNAVSFAGGVPEGFFTGDASRYRFMGIFYARTNENGVVVSIGTDPVTSIAFAPMGENGYFGLYFDGDPENAVGDWDLYAVYAEIPRIYYVKEGANGALTQIAPLTYLGEPLTNMGFGDTTVAQGTDIDVDAGKVVSVATSAGVGKFNVPKLLDSAYEGLRMTQSAFAAGPVDAANMGAMDGVTDGATLQLKTVDGLLKWSVDGEAWNEFSGSPAVYVAYKEPGFNLTFVKTSLAADADKAADSFVVTISSANLPNGVTYAVSGYSTEEISPVDGVITLSSITNGSRVTIHALPDDPNLELNRQYAILEQPAADYTLTNILVNGYAPSKTIENGVETILSEDKTVEFTNIKSYTITFVDENGSEIGSGVYPYGTKPSELTDGVVPPTKERVETTIYHFNGWNPKVESVGSNTTYTAEYKVIKIPQVTQRVADTNLVVVLESDQALIDTLKTQGIDLLADGYSQEEANAILNTVDANGLRRWENLVTGTASNQFLLSTSTESARSSAMRLAVDFDAAKYADLGYTVLHDLRKEQDGTWVRVAGPATGNNPSFSIELQDEGGNSRNASGLYRVVTLIVPNQNLSITNEIPSTNIIGVLEINNAVSNTITAVPWKQLASDPAAARDITVSNFVAALNLSAGDAVYTLDAEQRGYQMWNRQANGIWEPVTTVRTADDGGSLALQAESADVARLPRGNAVWVNRADTTKPYFLVGQYDEAEITVAVPGKTDAGAGLALIAIPTFKPLYLNKPENDDGTQAYIDWSKFPVDAADQIRVPVNGVQTALTYQNGKWGYYVTTTTYNAKRKKYVTSSSFTPYTGIIPAGTGFFYFRMASGEFTFSWK